MSEIRRTTSIEIEEPPATERGLSLADLLAGAGWLAYEGTKLAAKGTIAGMKLAAHAIHAANGCHESPLSLSKAKLIIQGAPDAASAMRSLAAQPGLEIPVAESQRWTQSLKALSSNGGKGDLLKLTEGIIRGRQDRLQAKTGALVAEACQAIGFAPKQLNGSPGLVTAAGIGTRKITVEVAKDRDGGLRMHLDAHGFHGGECIRALDALQAELSRRGVSFRVDSRRRKDRSPAIEGRAGIVGQVQQRSHR